MFQGLPQGNTETIRLKPGLPGLESQLPSFKRLTLVVTGNLLDSIQVPLRNNKGKLIPGRSSRWRPAVGHDDGSDTDAHGLVETNTGGTSTAWT